MSCSPAIELKLVILYWYSEIVNTAKSDPPATCHAPAVRSVLVDSMVSTVVRITPIPKISNQDILNPSAMSATTRKGMVSMRRKENVARLAFSNPMMIRCIRIISSTSLVIKVGSESILNTNPLNCSPISVWLGTRNTIVRKNKIPNNPLIKASS